MEFGLTLRLDDKPKQAANLAKKVEEGGFDCVYLADRHKQYRDVYVHLAFVAERTSQISLGPGVTNPLSRDPIVTANAMATIDELSNGRSVLGLGRGGPPTVRALGKEHRATFKETAECIRIIRGFWSGEEFERGTAHNRLEWGSGRDIPIYIAAGGPQMNEFAGRFGDGVILANINQASLLETRIKQTREIRNARSEHLSSEMKYISHITTIVSADKHRAYELVKPRVLETVIRHPHVVEDCGFDIDFDRYKRVHSELSPKPYDPDWQTAVEKTQFISDEVVRSLSLAGSPSEITKQIRQLERTGIDQLFLRPFFYEFIPPLEETRMEYFIDMFREEVIPHFSNP